MNKLKTLLTLFLTMFKIGLFTFGGGYAMVAIIEREIVEKRSWLNHEEYLDILAIAESSPGPIAINTSTFVGYKIMGVLGSIFATLGVVMPSFLVIYVISFFLEEFLALEYVSYAFKGIQVCVGFLILTAGIKMLKKIKKSLLSYLLIIFSTLAFLAVELLAVNFSTIFFILIGGFIGLLVYLIGFIKGKSNNGGKE